MLFILPYLTGIAKYKLTDVSANQGIVTFKDLAFYRAKATEIIENINKRKKAYKGMKSSIKQGEVRNGDKDKMCTSRIRLCFQV